MCDNIGACCKQYGFAVDAAACAATYKSTLQTLVGMASQNPPVVQYDPQAAGDCVKLTREAALACSLTDAARDVRNQACAKAVHGTKTAGQACNAPIECAPSSDGYPYCQYASGPTPTPVCLGSPPPSPRASQGQECDGTCIGSMGCVMVPGSTGDKGRCYDSDGLYCDKTSKVCVASPAAGQPCAEQMFCAKGSRCSNSTCKAFEPAKIGAPCVDSLECESGAECTNKICAPENLMASKSACSGAP
ncbi:MAG: hypothetical protein HY898_35705 [Deltaproteobacteria bacterium]|nr:hypothetical protein [Deltaproteobacteria bacterium]